MGEKADRYPSSPASQISTNYPGNYDVFKPAVASSYPRSRPAAYVATQRLWARSGPRAHAVSFEGDSF